VRIRVGEAFDVVGERVQRDGRRIGDTHEVECEITLRSHEPEDVTVSVIGPARGPEGASTEGAGA
jgi:hypothetical protein